MLGRGGGTNYLGLKKKWKNEKYTHTITTQWNEEMGFDWHLTKSINLEPPKLKPTWFKQLVVDGESLASRLKECESSDSFGFETRWKSDWILYHWKLPSSLSLSLSLSLSALNLLRSHWDLDWIYWDPVRSRQDLVRYGPDHLRSTRDLIDIRRNLVSTTLAISSKTNRHPAKPKMIWSVPGVGPWRVYFCSTRSSRVGYELSLNPIRHDLWTTLL